MSSNTELLAGVSIDELEALAAGMLVPSTQGRLEELMAGAEHDSLSANEAAELDGLLNKVDQLNLLKARARFTIDQLGAKASNP
jgi:hypothetical protein